MPRSGTILLTFMVLIGGLSSAWAFVVTDPATTARNAITAVLNSQIVETVLQQRERLRRMAERLSAHTSLAKYATRDAPTWQPADTPPSSFSSGYLQSLNSGDANGAEYERVVRTRHSPDSALTNLTPAERAVVERGLATLDIADSTLIAGSHYVGAVRAWGQNEQRTITALEQQVIDPSQEQSAAAVLDKISGAVLLETRQRQARMQLMTALLEQLLVDSKRARDTEAAALNMQRGRLLADPGESGGWLAGAGEDLRNWRQP